MDYNKELKQDTLFISESNYSCQLFDESFIKMKNDKNKQIYKLEEKEKDIYENQEELAKKMLELISNNQNQFKHKYNLLQKREELYHNEYNIFNQKIRNILNQYNVYRNNCFLNINNLNNMHFNQIFDIFDNQWAFPEKESIINNNNIKSFKSKCNIKSCEKKIIKNKSKTNSNIFQKRSNSKTYRKTFNSIKTLNNLSSVSINQKNKIISKMERKNSIKYNNEYINKKNKKKEKIKKCGTTRTNTKIDNNSLFEENNINYDDNKYDMKYFNDKDNNNEINDNDKIIIKPDYSKYLTRDNFYPKSYRIEPNRERLSKDEILYKTKTSFRDNRMKKELYDKAFKKCNYQSNL